LVWVLNLAIRSVALGCLPRGFLKKKGFVGLKKGDRDDNESEEFRNLTPAKLVLGKRKKIEKKRPGTKKEIYTSWEKNTEPVAIRDPSREKVVGGTPVFGQESARQSP